MKLAAHVTFFYNEKRLGYLGQTVSMLRETGADVFVHTNGELPRGIADGVQIVRHDLHDVHPYRLVQFSRPMMAEQSESGLYDYYMYIEDDIAFGPENFCYYLKYHETAKAAGSYIGFLRVEYDKSGGRFLTDLTHRLSEKIVLSGKEFIACDDERYQAMWLLDAEEMEKFISLRDLFCFKASHYGGGTGMIRENSAIGPAYEMFRHKLIVQEPGCFIHHIPDNYIGHNTFCKIGVNDLFFPR